jgi:NADH-quinone oxidoreductase subunit J
MEQTRFSVFSGVSILASLMVVRLPHPVHAVLSLIVAFVSASALMLLLQLEFMALIFVVVYVGAIAVLFLFVVMMLNLAPSSGRFGQGKSGTELLASFRVALTLYGRLTASQRDLVSLETGTSDPFVQWVTLMDPVTSMETLGQILYTHRFLYVLMAGFVLLVALVGAIVLTLKVRRSSVAKRQQLYQQLSRDADNAVMFVRDSKDHS